MYLGLYSCHMLQPKVELFVKEHLKVRDRNFKCSFSNFKDFFICAKLTAMHMTILIQIL